MLVHATTVAIAGRAVLMRGAAGAGKSDLALRLLSLPMSGYPALAIPPLGAVALVADDQVELTSTDAGVLASPPTTIAGKIEVRGLGLIQVPARRDVPVALVVDLTEARTIDRMPEPRSANLLGIDVPAISVDARDASAPMKILIALFHRIER